MKTSLKLAAALTAGTLFAAPVAAESYTVEFGPSVIADALVIDGVARGEGAGEIAVFDFSDGALGERLAAEIVDGTGSTNLEIMFDTDSMPEGDIAVVSFDAVGNELDREIIFLQ